MYRTLLARCEYRRTGVFLFLQVVRTLYSHLAKQGAVHFSPFPLPELLNPIFFAQKNFNIFYNSEPEKFSGRSPRAPSWPEKIPPKPEKNFISEVNFSISEVEAPDFQAKKEERTPCLGLFPLRQYKDNIFFCEMQIALTVRNTLRNVKRRVLHTRGFAMCYITRLRPVAL